MSCPYNSTADFELRLGAVRFESVALLDLATYIFRGISYFLSILDV